MSQRRWDTWAILVSAACGAAGPLLYGAVTARVQAPAPEVERVYVFVPQPRRPVVVLEPGAEVVHFAPRPQARSRVVVRFGR